MKFTILHDQVCMGDIYSILTIDDAGTPGHQKLMFQIKTWFKQNIGPPIYHTTPMTFITDRHQWFAYDYRTICAKDSRHFVLMRLELNL